MLSDESCEKLRWRSRCGPIAEPGTGLRLTDRGDMALVGEPGGERTADEIDRVENDCEMEGGRLLLGGPAAGSDVLRGDSGRRGDVGRSDESDRWRWWKGTVAKRGDD